ncbi:MAG: hypothetical protein ACOYOU_04480 [Kiritimatiellia bacterium]
MEIKCTSCKRVALARMEPVYEDFKKIAEPFVCSACGYRYPSREKTPFLDAGGRPLVFSEADKPTAAKVFQSEERRRSCAWCRNFIVNPFYQRCGLNNRTVEATDICARFTAKAEQPAEAAKSSTSTASSSRFDALFHTDPPAEPATREPTPPPALPPQSPPPKKTAAKPRKKTG